MMKRLLCLLSLLIPLAASAWDCVPAPQIPLLNNAPETLRMVQTPAGKAYSWWCLVKNAAGADVFKVQVFVVLNKYVDLNKWGAASVRALSASDVLATANSEILAAQVVPQAGSMDEYEAKRLSYLGCLGLAVEVQTFTAPINATFCGTAPVPPTAPPPPPPTQYVVSVTQAFPLKADGTRSITLWPQPAIVGEPADGSIKILQFGATFCKVPRLSTAATTVVAGCRVKP